MSALFESCAYFGSWERLRGEGGGFHGSRIGSGRQIEKRPDTLDALGNGAQAGVFVEMFEWRLRGSIDVSMY